MILSIEGNIGAGKTTIMNGLRLHYEDDPRVGFVDEPVGAWETVTDEDGKGILQLYYEDQKKHAFAFQMLALKTRASSIKAKARDPRVALVITERDITTDKKVFAQMLADSGTISKPEKQIYDMWFRGCEANAYCGRHVHRLYLRTTPALAARRTAKRQRTGESDIPLDYHEACHDAHERWILSLGESERVFIVEDMESSGLAPEAVLSLVVRAVEQLLVESATRSTARSAGKRQPRGRPPRGKVWDGQAWTTADPGIAK